MASTSGRTVAEISRVAKESIKCLGYDNILPEQETAIINFVRGHDVFVCLPTGCITNVFVFRNSSNSGSVTVAFFCRSSFIINVTCSLALEVMFLPLVH